MDFAWSKTLERTGKLDIDMHSAVCKIFSKNRRVVYFLVFPWLQNIIIIKKTKSKQTNKK